MLGNGSQSHFPVFYVGAGRRVTKKGSVLLKTDTKNIISVLIGSALIVCICLILDVTGFNEPIRMIVKIIVSALAYGVVMLLFKNSALMEIIYSVRIIRR